MSNSRKRSYLIALLLSTGVFSTQIKAEQAVNKIHDKSLSPLIHIMEKGHQGVVSSETIWRWEGHLSNDDHLLVNHLVDSNLYDAYNAEIFVRTLSADNVSDLTSVLNSERLREAARAVAATQ